LAHHGVALGLAALAGRPVGPTGGCMARQRGDLPLRGAL